MDMKETIISNVKTLMAKNGARHTYKGIITNLNKDEYHYCFDEIGGMTVGLINACLECYDESTVDSQVETLFRASNFNGWDELLGFVVYQMEEYNIEHLYDIINSLMSISK